MRHAVNRSAATLTDHATQSEPVHLDRVDRIEVGPRLRGIDERTVIALMASIDTIGLRSPLTVAEIDTGLLLVAGAHRLEAARRLGLEKVETFHVPKADAPDMHRAWEIAENLHRAELTVQERADHIAEWIRLTSRIASPAQLAPVKSRRADGRGGSLGAGINAAVRELGIDRTEAQRAVKIASIPAEAREIADAAGLDTQRARLGIAKASQPVAKAQQLAAAAARGDHEQRLSSVSGATSAQPSVQVRSVSKSGLKPASGDSNVPFWDPPRDPDVSEEEQRAYEAECQAAERAMEEEIASEIDWLGKTIGSCMSYETGQRFIALMRANKDSDDVFDHIETLPEAQWRSGVGL